MLRRTLFLGLGGSGGVTLRLLKHELVSRLDDLGWTSGIPSGWQFLHIDTPPMQVSDSSNVPPLEPDEYLGLRPHHLGPVQFAEVLERVFRTRGAVREVGSWASQLAAINNILLDMGAGQNRAVGRLVGLASMQLVAGGLASALSRLQRPAVIAELDRLNELLISGPSQAHARVDSALNVVIVSSLSGGTASGLFLDVADLLHTMHPGTTMMAFHYTPDVTASSSHEDSSGNTIAAICELINRMAWGEARTLASGRGRRGVPERRTAARWLAGIPDSVGGRMPFMPHYLVGAENRAGVSLVGQDSVFRSVSGLLATLQMDPELNGRMLTEAANSYFWFSASGEASILGGGRPEDGVAGFGALGYAQVTLGTREFHRYAAERLARAASERLLSEDLSSTEHGSTAQEHAEALRDALSYRGDRRSTALVLSPTERSESGAALRELAAALTPARAAQWIEQELSRIKSELDGTRVDSATGWSQRIVKQVRLSQQVLEERVGEYMAQTLELWVEKVNLLVPERIKTMVIDLGFEGSAEVVRELLTEIEGSAAYFDELTERARELRSFATTEVLEEVVGREFVDSLSPDAIFSDSSDVLAAVEEGMRHAWCSALADITERPVLAIKGLSRGVIDPLVSCLRMSKHDVGRASEEREEWVPWSPALPPDRFGPAAYEFRLINPQEFDAIFVAALEETCQGSGPAARDRAVREILQGSSPGAPAEALVASGATGVISVAQRWIPGPEVTGRSDVAESAAQFRGRCGNEALLALATDWLMRPDSPFGTLLTADLRSYTAGDSLDPEMQAEFASRRTQVLTQIDAAARAAEPMVQLSAKVLNGLLAETPIERAPVRALRWSLPFADHPLQQEVERWWKQWRNLRVVRDDRSDAPRLDLVSGSAHTIEFVATLQTAVHPLAVDSLMKPVAETWRAAQSDPARIARFWRYRRARTLDEFVPTSQTSLRCMLRGWLTGRMLKIIRWEGDGLIIEERESDAVRHHVFPIRFLPGLQQPSDGELIGQVFESMPVAYLNMALGSGWPDSFAAYKALAALGTSSGRSRDDALEYTSLNAALEAAVAEEQPISQSDAVHWLETYGMTLRADADPFEKLRMRDQTVLGRDETAVQGTPAWFDLYDDIQAARDDLLEALVLWQDSGNGFSF